MKRPLSMEEVEELQHENRPVSRKSTVRIYGGKASETGELFSKESLEFEDEDGCQNLEFYSTGSCDFGHLLGDGVEITGKCSIPGCGAFVCSKEGCMRLCERGHVVCGKHSVVWEDGRIFCRKHAPFMNTEKVVERTGKFLSIAGMILQGMGRLLKAVIGSWWPSERGGR